MNRQEFERFLEMTSDLKSIGVPKHAANVLESLLVDPQGRALRSNNGGICNESLVGVLSHLDDHVKLEGRRGTGKSNAFALSESLWIEQKALPVRLSGPAMSSFLASVGAADDVEAALYAYFLQEILEALKRYPQKHSGAYARSAVANEYGGGGRAADFDRELPELLLALRSIQVPGAGASTTLKASDKSWTIGLLWEKTQTRCRKQGEDLIVTLHSLQVATRKLIDTLRRVGVNKIGLFVDDISELDIPSKDRLAIFLQRLIAVSPNAFCIKLSVYPGRMYGLPGFDAMGLVLASTDPLFYRAGIGSTNLRDEDDFVLTEFFWPILEARLRYYNLHIGSVLGTSDERQIEAFLKELFWSSSGIPRACGSILYSAAQMTKESLADGERFIGISELRAARNRYFDGNISAHVPRYMTFVAATAHRNRSGIILSDFMTNLTSRFRQRSVEGRRFRSSFIASERTESALGPLISIGALMKRAQFELDGPRTVLSINYRRCAVANLSWDEDAEINVDDAHFKCDVEMDDAEIEELLKLFQGWLEEIGCANSISI